MPKNRPEEEEDDLDSALLAVTTKRKKSDEEEEEGELVDEKYEDSKPLKKRKSAKTYVEFSLHLLNIKQKFFCGLRIS